MVKKLDMPDDERKGREYFEDLMVDREGNEVLCGLSRAETEEYRRLSKQAREGSLGGIEERSSRYLELYDKFAAARRALILAQIRATDSGQPN